MGREIAELCNRRTWKRARAPHLLGDMASRRAAGPLLAALEDRKRDVRAAAARSLGTLQCVEAVEPLVDALVSGRVPRAVVGQALLTIGSASRERLRGLVPHADPEVRAVAAWTGPARRRGGRRDGREQIAGGAVSILKEALAIASVIAFAYFAILNATYLVFTAIAWRDVTRYRRARS